MAYVDILKEEASRLTHLVDNVLSYARVEKNSVTLRPERISVLALATSVIARISPRLAASGMDSQLFIAPELQSESVMADHDCRGTDRVQSGGQCRQIRPV